MLLAAAGKAQSQLLSPEPMLTGRQEVWKASLKLQEKFGKISCNYPNDSCTNHTTAPQIPCLQAEPKPTYGFKETCRGPQGGGERANRLQGLCFCWEGEGCSLKVLSSSVLFRADPSYGNSSSCLSLRSFLPLPTPPFSQPLPVPETLNRGSQDRVTAGEMAQRLAGPFVLLRVMSSIPGPLRKKCDLILQGQSLPPHSSRAEQEKQEKQGPGSPAHP